MQKEEALKNLHEEDLKYPRSQLPPPRHARLRHAQHRRHQPRATGAKGGEKQPRGPVAEKGEQREQQHHRWQKGGKAQHHPRPKEQVQQGQGQGAPASTAPIAIGTEGPPPTPEPGATTRGADPAAERQGPTQTTQRPDGAEQQAPGVDHGTRTAAGAQRSQQTQTKEQYAAWAHQQAHLAAATSGAEGREKAREKEQRQSQKQDHGEAGDPLGKG